MEEIGIPANGKVICEPTGRNTAPAILLAALQVVSTGEDAVLGIFPADHVIKDLPEFHDKLTAAVDLAAQGNIVTFGITPHYPETGYGYVEGGGRMPGGALAIRRFVEKPDLETARSYIAAGNFFWNSGMFASRASVILEEFRTHHPSMLHALEKMFVPGRPIHPEDYQRLPDLSFDHAVMEKTARGVVLPSDFGWSDIGSWKSLYDFLPKDRSGNVVDGDVIALETHNCFILGHERLIATNRLQNLVVVETPDSIFVSDLDHSREVKTIVSELKQKGRCEYHRHRTMHFPWGTRTLLEQADGYRTSRLVLYPQTSAILGETSVAFVHLLVLSGRCNVRAGRRRRFLAPGDAFTLSTGGALSIDNLQDGRLELIEVVLTSARILSM
jgi:mannose-1-phosphate guanylyltransferase/mannose-6-phosphate isomerase